MITVIVGVAMTIMAASSANGGSLDIKIVLQGDTGLYLSRINRGTRNPIEVAKAQPDIYCQFEVIKNADGKYSFKADNGKYLSRINRGYINPIEAYKSEIDVYSKFEVKDYDNGKISLQADNGLWWSRINRGAGYNPVEAYKSEPDYYSQFTVAYVYTAGKKYASADFFKLL